MGEETRYYEKRDLARGKCIISHLGSNRQIVMISRPHEERRAAYIDGQRHSAAGDAIIRHMK